MAYTVKQLAELAGVSVRTLHYYDEKGLLKPESRNKSGYRYYGDEAVVRLQQIMFFRELGFNLEEIGNIISRPDFDVLKALQSHRILLTRKAERINHLLTTVDKTIKELKGEIKMQIKEFYEGFSDKQIEKYREEVRERWGEKTLQKSEQRVINMGKEKFVMVQAEGGKIFKDISDNMPKGFESPEVQELVARWREWLENFHQYSDEAVLELGRSYSEDARFAKYFRGIHENLPEFLTKAIQYYCSHKG
ncbi:MAG: MerR family transcriptional regulator [Dehalococcoidales bacterium]|nr:MerR family transcriptional regulator [Dehalococcoidales bacterium]MDD4230381.1 MerR family transcriptional regulator [Dehalococcoidales bacterium]MDD4465220.1 MerR family transcriptional regulator [Dehalococcoidales bacterium]MDD5401890.1 MerR family transcriptional regulator [Dehalococcoidales bacterium]